MRALPLLFLTACTDPLQGTDTGNAYTVGVVGHSEARRAASAATFTEAWIVLEDVRVEPCEEAEDRTDLEGPFAVDLLAGELLGASLVEGGAVCALRMDIDEIDEGESPDPALDDLSVLLIGTTAAGTPFEIHSALGERFRIEDDAGLFSDGEPTGILLSFALDEWIAGLDIDAQGGGEGVLIDEDNNEPLLELFEENIERSAELLRDSDGDLVADDG